MRRRHDCTGYVVIGIFDSTPICLDCRVAQVIRRNWGAKGIDSSEQLLQAICPFILQISSLNHIPLVKYFWLQNIGYHTVAAHTY